MKKIFVLLLAAAMLMGLASFAMATNGDNMIGIGPISRAMGGVGIAAPQDAISATFANPAGMCFGPYCPGSEVNFSGTMFLPRVNARLVGFGPTATAKDSDKKTYVIPAFGLSVPINDQWRFGLAAYGISGLGVDYRDTGLTTPPEMNTQVQIMKFSPNVAYRVNDNLSLGLGVHIDYSAADFGQGSAFGYAMGAQVGAIYKVNDNISLGITYKTPQSVKHENVYDFDGNGTQDDLKLAIPQEIGLGLAVEPMPGKLLIELDGKWVNWANAKGYEDFDWRDQYVVAVGAQYKPIEKVALRIGYNYAKSPVKLHNNFNAAGATMVQGVAMPTANYEFFRIVGFPAIAEQHLTLGFGYDVTDNLALNVGYMHAFKETLTETSPVYGMTLESQLHEDSVELGITYRFK